MPHEDLDGIVERMLDGSEHSRRQFIRHLAGAGLLLGPGSAFLAACGGVKGESSGKKVSAAVNHPKVPIGDWTFSNWPLYIDKSVLKSFDKKYGGHVKYVEDINDNFEFFGKVRQQLAAGKPIGRDIVTLTDYMAARWVRDGYVTAIDKKNVPNAKNLVSNLQTIGYDPHRNFTLPWQSGAIGIGYDPRKTGRKLHSIQDFFDPKFKGRVSFLSEPSVFWAKTVSSSPPAARIRYWMETPRNEATTTVPRSTLVLPLVAWSPATSVTFSGRTPTRTPSP